MCAVVWDWNTMPGLGRVGDSTPGQGANCRQTLVALLEEKLGAVSDRREGREQSTPVVRALAEREGVGARCFQRVNVGQPFPRRLELSGQFDSDFHAA